MKNKEICGLCKKEINLKKDDYCHLEDFRHGKFYMRGWYHKLCWNDNLKNNKTRMAQADALLNKAARMMGFKEEKIYEVK